jgi:hypothetical protein
MPDLHVTALEPVLECADTEPGKDPASAPEQSGTLSARPHPPPPPPHRLSIFPPCALLRSYRVSQFENPTADQFVIVIAHTPPFKGLPPITPPAGVAGTICTDAVPTEAPAVE